jgi:hypothetical protein
MNDLFSFLILKSVRFIYFYPVFFCFQMFSFFSPPLLINILCLSQSNFTLRF